MLSLKNRDIQIPGQIGDLLSIRSSSEISWETSVSIDICKQRDCRQKVTCGQYRCTYWKGVMKACRKYNSRYSNLIQIE